MFERAAVLPDDLILGQWSTSAPRTQHDYSKQTAGKMQFAWELARCNLNERADKQAAVNKTLSSWKTAEKVLIHRTYNEAPP